MSINSVNTYYKPVSEQQKTTSAAPKNTNALNKNNEKIDLKTVSSNNVLAYHASFNGLGDKFKEMSKMRAINKYLDSTSKEYLKQLKASGILNDTNSNDGSSVLDNLHKIATTERLQGLSKENILRETVKLLANPYSISQKFGDLPKEIIPKIEQETNTKISPETYQVSSATCFATSIEFNLVQKQPAEFTRMVEGLTSPEYSIKKQIKVSDISPNYTEALHDLNQYKTEYKIEPDWNTLTVTLKPDRNAIVRARVQNSYKDENERSCVDVLMQSMIMNLGSQHTYNALTDIRTGELNPDNTGLTNQEGNFANKILEGKHKISVIYQDLDTNGKLVSHYYDNDTIKNHIDQALDSGNNLIVGYTILDDSNTVMGGHEVTLTGKTVQDGKVYYICNDSDDENPEPILMEAESFIPKIHHADLPAEIFSGVEQEAKNQWKYELQAMKEDWLK